jgi:FAD/FMN-containing dehydrogenase
MSHSSKKSSPKKRIRKSARATSKTKITRAKKFTPDFDIASHIRRLQHEPNDADALAQIQNDLQTRDLSLFFQAMTQTGTTKGSRSNAEPPSAAFESERGLFDLFVNRKGDEGVTRATWRNCIGSLSAQPLKIFRPASLDELRSVMQQAARDRCCVRAVGSGHTFTDIAVTTDYLIETSGLNQAIALETEVLRDGVETEMLFETECGVLIRKLNELLWDAGLAMINLGGYDGQTVMGILSTSTHGSGIEFGPITDFVQSFTVVGEGGVVRRIEPRDGVTDPARWLQKHPDIVLIQDDDWFRAMQVGIGCLGVVYSVILRAMPRYKMLERRTVSAWSQVKSDLQNGQTLKDNRHYEVLVNPYKTNGDFTCLITTRNIVDSSKRSDMARPFRNFLIEFFAGAPTAARVLSDLIEAAPKILPGLIDGGMKALERDYVDRSYRVFNIGAANYAPAYGSEIGVPIDRVVEATERILDICANSVRIGQAYLTSPFSLRFVKASAAFMSMMYERDTCMIELISLDQTTGGRELFKRIENDLYSLGGRPHWGLLNFLNGSNGLIERLYPAYPKWKAIHDQLNANETFNSPFTDRVGFSNVR